MDVSDFAEAGRSGPPQRLGQRYSAEAFLPDPGNTVVCHLDLKAPAAAAVLAARAAMMALPGADRFLFTPVDSLHMTVFEGVLDNRRRADAWPAFLPPDATVENVTAAMLDRLEGFVAPGPFSVRAAALSPVGLRLTGATAEDAAVMAAWRHALTEPFGYRHATHDAYQFHMTFAYPIAWLPADLVPIWEEALPRICADLVAATPVLPLQAPAFCRFADMTAFEELRVLR